jgi:hypothetical protein
LRIHVFDRFSRSPESVRKGLHARPVKKKFLLVKSVLLEKQMRLDHKKSIVAFQRKYLLKQLMWKN